MVVYVVVLALVGIILIASYRSLGGGAASEADIEAFVKSVRTWVDEASLSAKFLAGDESITDEQVETAREVRKKVSGYQQQLNRLIEDEGERDDLSLAIEA